jgi:hypothetical protein
MSNFPKLIPAFTCLVSGSNHQTPQKLASNHNPPQNAHYSLICLSFSISHIFKISLFPLPSKPQLSSGPPSQIVLNPRQQVGAVSSSGPLTLAPFHPSGSLKSEPGYPISIDATFVHGSDYIRQDASQKHVRLDVNSLLKDKSGAMIKFDYSGIVEVTPPTRAALMGAEGAKTTDFGDASEYRIRF